MYGMQFQRSLVIPCAFVLATGCLMRTKPYSLPAVDPATPEAVIDIHAHFFNFLCDFPPTAAGDPFHVGDKKLAKKIVASAAESFKKKRGDPSDWERICNCVGSSKGATRLTAGDYGVVDFARAAVSDRRAIAASYFQLFPEVMLVTPSLIDADGWLNDPNQMPTVRKWRDRHFHQQQLTQAINEHYGFVRVLPIAGFNPMRGVEIDCRKPLEYTTECACENQWAWRHHGGSEGGDYLAEFSSMLKEPGVPFVGIKIYPSLGYHPTPQCEWIGEAWQILKQDLASCDDPDTRDEYAVCHIAAAVAMAPIRNPEAWEALPVPAETSGCRAVHDALVRGWFEGNVQDVRFGGTEENIEYSDYGELRSQVQLVAFLRLTAEIDRVMADMMRMANDHDIPILTHASPEGFALDDGFFEYGFPEQWEGVLETYPNLRVLFAHAGGSMTEGKKKEDSFFDAVRCLQRHHPRVYVDYSNRHGRAWETPSASCGGASTRAVYGSDFWMMTLGGKSGKSKGYLESHRDLFPSPQDTAYMYGNAINFLAPEKGDARKRICNYAKSVGLEFAPAIHARLCP
jgi:hypothetical protein